MRYHAAWASLVWLLLSLVQVAHSAQGDNILSHARERIWLWEMYSFFCDIEGAENQKMFMVQNKDNKWDTRKHFSLSNTKDGKLTYAEFQADLMKKLNTFDVDKTVVAPGAEGNNKPTVAEAVDKLKSKGWAMPLDVEQATSGKSKDYNDLIGRVNAKFQEYYNTPTDDDTLKRKLIETNMRTESLSKDIVALRQQEADEWVLRQMTRDVDSPNASRKAYGLGLSRDDLVITTVTSEVDGATKWEKVDFAATFRDMSDEESEAFNRKLVAAGITDGKFGLVSWADNLGNQVFAGFGPGYSDQNESHFQVSQTWKNTHTSAVRRLGGLSASCSR
ncbi:hypothetical protein FLONG3_9990 [Fusarium longipes]|uniref:EF-hand domain-containing protein n=1 Tax=Fusarium longipes TaxID=694270 RepID=A0A395RT81_9HYPO|nr:hypothetical protein FLONG3_9990 [Fusarium longipes]